MDEQRKTTPDSTIVANVLAEREKLQGSDSLNAAERLAVRELLGLRAELVELAQNYRFEKEATARLVLRRDAWKGWIAFATGVGGFIAMLITTYISVFK